jgi:hypothetical protein
MRIEPWPQDKPSILLESLKTDEPGNNVLRSSPDFLIVDDLEEPEDRGSDRRQGGPTAVEEVQSAVTHR